MWARDGWSPPGGRGLLMRGWMALPFSYGFLRLCSATFDTKMSIACLWGGCCSCCGCPGTAMTLLSVSASKGCGYSMCPAKSSTHLSELQGAPRSLFAMEIEADRGKRRNASMHPLHPVLVLEVEPLALWHDFIQLHLRLR